MNLTIPKENAVKAYNEADKSFKKILELLFGKDNLLPQKITDRIKTFEDACAALSYHPKNVLPYANPETNDERACNAFRKLTIIARALNEGWTPDWRNSSQYKYFAWFKDSGSGLSYYAYVCTNSRTTVGSRLCFSSSELAVYAGQQFESIYREYLSL